MFTQNETVKAIAYTRCSTQEQADSGLGLEAQEKRIGAYATLKGLDLVDVITDAGVSGGKPLASRQGGQRLLTAEVELLCLECVAKAEGAPG